MSLLYQSIFGDYPSYLAAIQGFYFSVLNMSARYPTPEHFQMALHRLLPSRNLVFSLLAVIAKHGGARFVYLLVLPLNLQSNMADDLVDLVAVLFCPVHLALVNQFLSSPAELVDFQDVRLPAMSPSVEENAFRCAPVHELLAMDTFGVSTGTAETDTSDSTHGINVFY